MPLFGAKKTATCGHTSSSPFKTKCTRASGHAGKHGNERGLTWSGDGKIAFGRGKGTRK